MEEWDTMLINIEEDMEDELETRNLMCAHPDPIVMKCSIQQDEPNKLFHKLQYAWRLLQKCGIPNFDICPDGIVQNTPDENISLNSHHVNATELVAELLGYFRNWNISNTRMYAEAIESLQKKDIHRINQMLFSIQNSANNSQILHKIEKVVAPPLTNIREGPPASIAGCGARSVEVT